MSSELIWKSIDLHYSLNRYLSTFPIHFNKKTREFSAIQNSKTLRWWYFWMIIGIGVLCIGAQSFIIIQQSISPKEHISSFLCIMWGLTIIASGTSALLASTAAYPPLRIGLVILANQLIQVEKNLRSAAHGEGQKLPIWKTAEGNLDIIGILCVLSVPILWSLTPLLTAVVMHQGLLPWPYILEDIIPSHIYSMWITKCVVFLMSTFFMFLITAEILRCIPVFYFFTGISALIFLNMIHLLDKVHDNTILQKDNRHGDFGTLRLFYNQMKILLLASNAFVGPQGVFILTFGSIASPVLNFASLKLYNALPAILYPIIPVATVAVFVSIVLGISFVTNIFENSESSLTAWKGQAEPRNKFWRKSLRSMKSLQIHAGINQNNFFMFDQELKGTYFSTVVNNTINLLMTVPQSAIDDLERSLQKI